VIDPGKRTGERLALRLINLAFRLVDPALRLIDLAFRLVDLALRLIDLAFRLVNPALRLVDLAFRLIDLPKPQTGSWAREMGEAVH
jgi:hypothetical protein